MKRRGELRMIQRAIVQGWDVPDDEISRAVELIRTTIEDPDATHREKLAACRCQLAIERHKHK